MIPSLSQREQYAKGGIGRRYWDYRDRQAFRFIGGEKNILDIGCGEGITLEKLMRQFPNRKIQGIDYSHENVRICRSRDLPVHRGDAYGLAFEDRSFDCCLFLEVVEHLLEPGKALAEIHRVLRTGGLLLIIFPNDWLFKAARIFFLKFKEAFAASGHVQQWKPPEMRGALDKAGFDVQKMENLPFLPWPFSLHCLVAARKR